MKSGDKEPGDERSRNEAALTLKLLLEGASEALVRFDADRLEELASSCTKMRERLGAGRLEDRALLLREAQNATADWAVFCRVLEATRANLQVLSRLRLLRSGVSDYSETGARRWAPPEAGHGDD